MVMTFKQHRHMTAEYARYLNSRSDELKHLEGLTGNRRSSGASEADLHAMSQPKALPRTNSTSRALGSIMGRAPLGSAKITLATKVEEP